MTEVVIIAIVLFEALAVTLAAAVWFYRKGRRLEEQVAALQAQLDASKAQVGAYLGYLKKTQKALNDKHREQFEEDINERGADTYDTALPPLSQNLRLHYNVLQSEIKASEKHWNKPAEYWENKQQEAISLAQNFDKAERVMDYWQSLLDNETEKAEAQRQENRKMQETVEAAEAAVAEAEQARETLEKALAEAEAKLAEAAPAEDDAEHAAYPPETTADTDDAVPGEPPEQIAELQNQSAEQHEALAQMRALLDGGETDPSQWEREIKRLERSLRESADAISTLEDEVNRRQHVIEHMRHRQQHSDEETHEESIPLPPQSELVDRYVHQTLNLALRLAELEDDEPESE